MNDSSKTMPQSYIYDGSSSDSLSISSSSSPSSAPKSSTGGSSVTDIGSSNGVNGGSGGGGSSRSSGNDTKSGNKRKESYQSNQWGRVALLGGMSVMVLSVYATAAAYVQPPMKSQASTVLNVTPDTSYGGSRYKIMKDGAIHMVHCKTSHVAVKSISQISLDGNSSDSYNTRPNKYDGGRYKVMSNGAVQIV